MTKTQRVSNVTLKLISKQLRPPSISGKVAQSHTRAAPAHELHTTPKVAVLVIAVSVVQVALVCKNFFTLAFSKSTTLGYS